MASFKEWKHHNELRDHMRWSWHEFFGDYDVLILATAGMTAKCAKCHDHPLAGANDLVRWTQQERYPIDAHSQMVLAVRNNFV